MTTDSVSSASFVNASVNAQSPWLGLHSFTEELQEYFYGRDAEADELQRRVNRKTLTVLFGQSGLGKTSLLRAGLYPRLRRAGFLPFTVRVVHSTEAPPPAAQIIAAFVAAATAAKATLQSRHDGQEISLWEYFHHVGFAVQSEAGKPLVPVMVFDQFEEVFTLGAETEALRRRGEALLTEVADLVENRPPKELLERFEADPELVEQFQFDRADYRVLLSLREDYLANLEDVRARMPSLSENRMRLTRMNGEQALDAVSKPGGHLVAPAVSRQIVRFVAGASPADADRTDVDLTQDEVDPAMLSLFCAELNNRRRAQELPQITADLLAGSRETILLDYYERCLADAHPEVRRFVEDELLTEQGFRVDVPLEKAQKTLTKKGAAEDALDDLVKRRLLRIEERLHVRRVELTHDVLTSIVRHSRDERQKREEAALAQQREEHIKNQLRKARRRLAATIIAAASIIAIISTGFYIYLDRRVWSHAAYYDNFSKRRGVVFGIGELSPQDVAARAVSFKVTTKGRGPKARVMGLEAVDSTGKLTASHGVGTILSSVSDSDTSDFSRECRWEYIYDNEGRVVYETAFDRFGKMVWCFVYSPNSQIEKGGGAGPEIAHGHFIGENGYPLPQRNSSAEYVRIEYTPEGWERRRMYFDRNGKPQPGLDHAFGLQRTYDELGRDTSSISLDEKGQPMIDSAGNCGLEWSDFTDLGDSRQTVSYGTKRSELMPVNSGWTKQRREFDEHGNTTAVRYFDANDRPVTGVEGYAGYLDEYDRHGNLVKFTYIDEQGSPTTSIFGYASLLSEYDGHNEIERRHFDPDGKPTRIRLGVHLIKYERLPNGLITKQSYFDVDGKPTLTTDAIAGWTSEYDEGLEVKRLYFDAQGKPTLTKSEKIAGWMAKYDDRGNRVVRTGLGLDGQPVRSTSDFVTEKTNYDDFENPTLIRYFDEAGKPCRHKDGFAGFRAKYDGRGNRVEFEMFDEQEKPLTIKGYVGSTSKFDKLGRETARRYVDERGNPAEHADGYAKWTATYDVWGHEVERQLFDLSGKPLPESSAVAFMRTTYDQYGRAVQRTYLNAAEQPAPFADGYTRAEYKYDSAGRERQQTYLYEVRPHANGHRREILTLNEWGQFTSFEFQDAAGKPMRNTTGTAGTALELDSRGLAVRRIMLDEQGAPAPDGDGIASSTSQYDEYGREFERRYFDPAGKPKANANNVARASYAYDDRGNLTKMAFFDAADKPTLSAEEIAGWTSTYDDQHHELQRRFFGLDGKPKASNEGYAGKDMTYNDAGKLDESKYVDVEGKLAPLADGTTNTKFEYDATGRERKRTRFYGLRPHADGYRAESWSYDKRGKQVATEYWDEAGLPALNADGVASIRLDANDQTRTSRCRYFGIDGEPTLSNEGIHGWNSVFDARNNEVERQFIDRGETPTKIKYGFSKWTARYDDMGKMLEKTYRDDAGEPTPGQGGHTRVQYEYDALGRETKRTLYYGLKPHEDGHTAEALTLTARGYLESRTFLDASGRPMRSTGGFATERDEYDSAGHVTRKSFFDEKDQPTLSDAEISGWASTFDGRGNEIERQYFGVDGKPTVYEGEAFARWTIKYDDQNKVAERAYFDAAGKPALHADGYTRIGYKYDDGGKVTEQREYHDLEPHEDGYRVEVLTYDKRSQHIRTAFLDEAERPVANKNLVASIRYSRDERGNVIRMEFFDVESRPALSIEGIAGWTSKFDALDDEIERRFFDAAGEPSLLKGTEYAGWKATYVGSGKKVEETYFDLSGNPAATEEGYSSLRREYDDAGRIKKTIYDYETKADSRGYRRAIQSYEDENAVELAFYDDQGKPARHKDGYYRVTFDYDDAGNMTRRRMHFELDDGATQENDSTVAAGDRAKYPYAYADEDYEPGDKIVAASYHHRDGTLSTGPDGFARQVLEYDDEGELRSSRFVDEHEQPISVEVQINEIFPDSAAEKLKLQSKDVLVSFDGKPVVDSSSFIYARRQLLPDGGAKPLVVRRGQEELSFDLDAGAMGASLADRVPGTPAAGE